MAKKLDFFAAMKASKSMMKKGGKNLMSNMMEEKKEKKGKKGKKKIKKGAIEK